MLDLDELSGEEGGKMQRPKLRGTIYLDQSMCYAQDKLHSGAPWPKKLRVYALSDMKSTRSWVVRHK